MTLILSGTDGLSDVDGTAATPAIRGTDTNTGIFFPAADTIAFSEGGTEVARFDSSGNLLVGTTSASTPGTGFISVANTFGMKNRIINGGMVIDQRNAGASVTPTTSTYTVDRWQFQTNVASKISIQQNAGSVTPPTAFSRYLGFTTASAYTAAAGEIFEVAHKIEGFNFADMAWGTASAATVTLSFWVRSSLTGTHSGSMTNEAGNRSYPFTFTISAANTWEYKTVTIVGDTSGTWVGATNGVGVVLYFDFGSGSTFRGSAGAWASANFVGATGAVNLVGTNGATFYITGVQLERGSTATSFDFRPYGTELMMCQRYFQAASNFIYSTSFARVCYMFPVQMRTAPTLAGGGSGFSSSNVTVAGYCGEQTSGAIQSMTFSSEL